MAGKWLKRFKDSFVREELVFIMDLVISVFATMAVGFEISLIQPHLFETPYLTLSLFASSVGTSLLLFFIFKTYRIIIRHFGYRDVLQYGYVSLIKGILIFLVLLILFGFINWILLQVIFDIVVTFFLLVGIRVFMILGYNIYNNRFEDTDKQKKKKILVYGTTNKSVATLKRLQTSTHYYVVGFLERSDRKAKMLLDQRPVFNFDNPEALAKIIKSNDIDAVLFAKDTDAQSESDGVIDYCLNNKVKTLIIPNVDEVEDSKSILRPRDVKVEDLLGRAEIQISMDEIKSYFSGKVVMVTGAAGSIGSEIVRQLTHFFPKQIVLFDNAETPMHNLRLELEDRFKGLNFVPVIGDVRQLERLDYAFRKFRPQVVFHAAAYKHVPLMEENPCEAVLVNVKGSRNVADKCLEYDVEKMVMISTDKAVNPTNIMGCSKRLAEIYVQSLGLSVEKGLVKGRTKFVTTRFGNVLGSNGSVIPRFRQQIEEGGPVTVTHKDITRFFMTIPEACRLVLEAATLSSGNQIFVFDMGEPIKIDQLARRMISLAGFVPDKDIKIEYSGLRPGEKLYEEVLSDKENTIPAFHKRIRIAKVREYEYKDVDAVTTELSDLAYKVDIPDMVRLMKKTVPEYISGNSKFCEFDVKK
ncbi:MAG: polysaccharide biosynthesis protein [Bacteroidales bacterium]|nr:polysaccharide biosynthesis protein [Bacteroidales bacterium]